uniref:Uncharacterized protein n=1 Tax=viral metagenome TaxID=1070528 RepID=A0A2V0RLI9_9ZZZZ
MLRKTIKLSEVDSLAGIGISKGLQNFVNQRRDVLNFERLPNVIKFILSSGNKHIRQIFPDIKTVIGDTGVSSFLNNLSKASALLSTEGVKSLGFMSLPDTLLANALRLTLILLFGDKDIQFSIPSFDSLVLKINKKANVGLTDIFNVLKPKSTCISDIMEFLCDFLTDSQPKRVFTVFGFPVLVFTRLQIKKTIKTRLVFAVGGFVSICQILL